MWNQIVHHDQRIVQANRGCVACCRTRSIDLLCCRGTDIAHVSFELCLTQLHIASHNHKHEFLIRRTGVHQGFGSLLFGNIKKARQRFDCMTIGRQDLFKGKLILTRQGMLYKLGLFQPF